jgi:hypothetical protein
VRDFLTDKVGVGDDDTGFSRVENLAFQAKNFGMLAIQPAGRSFPERLESIASVEPGSMNAITRPINIAARNALKAEMNIAARMCGCEGRGEFVRRLPW